jgi:hypothetical protein
VREEQCGGTPGNFGRDRAGRRAPARSDEAVTVDDDQEMI